uniref:Uncharacterized protein n=1 Tax=Mastacembelus armatus TaxID=205130 RepID=A0A3Q3SG76_9TELE
MEKQVNAAVDKKSSRTEEHMKTEEAEANDTNPKSGTVSPAFLGNLLVVPMDGSHWIGIKAMAQEMGRRKHYNTVTYPVPYDKDYVDSFLASYKEVMKTSAKNFLEKISSHFSQLKKFMGLIHTTAESLLFNDSLISHLAQQRFDAVLTDPVVPTGSLIARKLGIPTINLLRGIPCTLDTQSSGCPSPPSYVPRFFTGYTDKMSFKERAVNTLVALLEPLLCQLLYWHFDHIAYQFLGEEVGIAHVLSDSAIWLLRIDFTLEFPRPLMPNIVLVGGINCNVRNPLPEVRLHNVFWSGKCIYFLHIVPTSSH